MSTKKIILTIGLLLVATAVIIACAPKTATPTTEPTPEAAPIEVPFEAAWVGSPHNDAEAEAFTHWNEEDPAVIPTDCARCHSSAGYQDFLGLDGSMAGTVDAEVAAPAGTIACATCHNDATRTLSEVTFPSGATITGLGPEARCMVCHQGRESSVSVNAAIEGLDLDTVSADLGFLNIHYFAAAATLYGGEAMGGYQYDGQSYDARHDHVEGYTTCIDCHDSHTLEVKLDQCASCHQGVASVEDLYNVREPSSLADYDGDGDVAEGMYYEIQGLQEMLLASIQAYAAEDSGTPIVYSSAAYPYFFIDTNANGAIDEGEGAFPNRFVTWTPRLLQAAYNYQLSLKDPGAFAHGNKYIVQLLFDSIADLNTKLASPVDMTAMQREDPGHFAGNTEAFRHWDGEDEGIVPGTCARCHTATGLPTFLTEGAVLSSPATNGFACTTCHDGANWPNRYSINSVTMPSGRSVTFGEGNDSNLCLACHQGRESTASVNRAIGSNAPDTVVATLSFRNVHYFPAGATLFGNEAQGMYQFSDAEYLGQNTHPGDGSLATCTSCHETHSLGVRTETCATCHAGVEDPRDIRWVANTTDWDGDGEASEPLAEEIATMADALYAAIQAQATTAGTSIVYSSAAYPYFFIDTNANGQPDADELNFGNRYNAWTPRLLIGAFNYQYAQKDPGAFAHNGRYVLQVLYDTIAYLGGDVSGMTRP